MASADSLIPESNINITEEPSTAASIFMKNVCDDLLSEILIRLDCRSAIQCSSVCKRWKSQISTAQFIQRFINHHRQQQQISSSHSPLYTFFFQSKIFPGDSSWPRHLPDSEFHQVFFEKSKILHGGIRTLPSATSDYLNFFPDPMLVMAWFEDLVLVSPSIKSENFYLCNPLTRQWHALPPAPRKERHGNLPPLSRVGLVCRPNCFDKIFGYHYRVVIVNITCGDDDFEIYRALIYSSETQKWSESLFRIPLPQELEVLCIVHPWNNGGVVACNGVLYWLSEITPTSRCTIVAFDPFKKTNEEIQWHFIDPPADLNPIFKFDVVRWMLSYRRSTNMFLGACQGRLRLARLPEKEIDGEEVLRVWELMDYHDNGTATWQLMQEISIEGKDIKFILGFDANNGNVIFVYSNNYVGRYNVLEDELKKIDKFPVPLGRYPLINGAANLVNCFHLMHPCWPTPVPPLPSIS